MWYFIVTFSGAADLLTGARAERWTVKELEALGDVGTTFRTFPSLTVSVLPNRTLISTTSWLGRTESSSWRRSTAEVGLILELSTLKSGLEKPCVRWKTTPAGFAPYFTGTLPMSQYARSS
jgi:hypothetical protein